MSTGVLPLVWGRIEANICPHGTVMRYSLPFSMPCYHVVWPIYWPNDLQQPSSKNHSPSQNWYKCPISGFREYQVKNQVMQVKLQYWNIPDCYTITTHYWSHLPRFISTESGFYSRTAHWANWIKGKHHHLQRITYISALYHRMAHTANPRVLRCSFTQVEMRYGNIPNSGSLCRQSHFNELQPIQEPQSGLTQ
jgi:hypothetical protein